MWPATVRHRKHHDNLIGPWCVRHRHGDCVKMVERPRIILVAERHVEAGAARRDLSFDYLIGDLVAPCRIDPGIPSNRDAEGEREGRC